MNGISTILWDIGGVLLTNGWDHQQRDAVLTHFGLDRAEFERRHAAVDQAWERDEIGVDEYLHETVFYQPRNFSQSEFLDTVFAQSAVLRDSGIGILHRLTASEEYVIATVNNEARALNEFRLKTFNLLDEFDAFFSSCYLGLRKPDPKIYRVALDVLQRDPSGAVFIDDRAENVAAAVSVGMHGIRYQSSEQLAAELSKLGVGVEEDRFHGLKVQEA
jgi:putative hydrolase of the HAD superfamily